MTPIEGSVARWGVTDCLTLGVRVGVKFAGKRKRGVVQCLDSGVGQLIRAHSAERGVLTPDEGTTGEACVALALQARFRNLPAILPPTLGVHSAVARLKCPIVSLC